MAFFHARALSDPINECVWEPVYLWHRLRSRVVLRCPGIDLRSTSISSWESERSSMISRPIFPAAPVTTIRIRYGIALSGLADFAVILATKFPANGFALHHWRSQLCNPHDVGLPTTRDSVKSTTSIRSWLALRDAARTLRARLLYLEEGLRFRDARGVFLGTLV